MGQWLDVDPGLNSENDAGRNHFAAAPPKEAVAGGTGRAQ
jgi:hypothetical protein